MSFVTLWRPKRRILSGDGSFRWQRVPGADPHPGQDTVCEDGPMTIRDDAAALAAELAELRHAIHAEPEIGLDLPKTQAKVLQALDGLPLEVATGDKLTSVTAVLRGGGQTARSVLLRGDMDALPVRETTGLPWASRYDGVMHACGHDLHTAMLAGAVKLLVERRASLAGDVIFMFQPGEEGYAGARYMLEEGVLDAAGTRPVAAYALHVSSNNLPLGAFSTKPGPMLAAADILKVTVRGRGGHASQPHRALDPIPAACEMVTALQSLVTRRFNVFDPVVITVGSFHAGTADNIIGDEATFLATCRSYSAESRERLRYETVRLVRDIAGGHGLTADAEYVDEYPVTLNDTTEAAFAAQAAAELFGEERSQRAEHPITGAEDFSFVAEQVPGAFLMYGACPPDRDTAEAPSNHSALAMFDDSVLADGAALLAELAVRRLATA
jgi:amidohydrolase